VPFPLPECSYLNSTDFEGSTKAYQPVAAASSPEMEAHVKRTTHTERLDHASIARRAGKILLTILLNYKIVLAVVWVVIIIWWLVLQVLPARPATLDQGEASRTVIQEPAAEPVLVTDTSTAVVKPNESQDED
jgi:hypothetical protein